MLKSSGPPPETRKLLCCRCRCPGPRAHTRTCSHPPDCNSPATAPSSPTCTAPGPVHGLDIGCGANLIYPLLGATLAGWSMVGADCTPAALEWAARNLGANPQLAELVELRAVGMQPEQQRYLTQAAGSKGSSGQGGGAGKQTAAAPAAQAAADAAEEAVAAEALAEAPAVATARPAAVLRLSAGEAVGSGIVSSAVRRGERFAFCMCNPPFFESLEEAGRNPATAYGGTAPEMVYPGERREGGWLVGLAHWVA